MIENFVVTKSLVFAVFGQESVDVIYLASILEVRKSLELSKFISNSHLDSVLEEALN